MCACVCLKKKHQLSICQMLFTDWLFTLEEMHCFFVCFFKWSACKWMAPVINQNLCHPSYLVLTCSTNRQSPETQTRSRGLLRCRWRRQRWLKTRLPCVTQCADPEIISQSRTTTSHPPTTSPLPPSPAPLPTPTSAPAFCFFRTPSAMGASSAVHYWWGLSWMWLCSSCDGHRAPASSHWGGEWGRGVKRPGCLALVPSCCRPIHPSH